MQTQTQTQTYTNTQIRTWSARVAEQNSNTNTQTHIHWHTGVWLQWGIQIQIHKHKLIHSYTEEQDNRRTDLNSWSRNIGAHNTAKHQTLDNTKLHTVHLLSHLIPHLHLYLHSTWNWVQSVWLLSGLPAGQSLLIQDQSCKMSRIWQIDPSKNIGKLG